MKQLISENIMLPSDISNIEDELTLKYGSVIRWAVVDIIDDKYKIAFTYEK